MSVYVTVRDIDDIRDVVQALINEAIEKHESDLADDYEARLDDAYNTIRDLEQTVSGLYADIDELNQQIRDLHLELQGLDE